MANLLVFDDDEMLSPKSVVSSTTNKSLDDIFAANQSMSQSADLDLLLQAQPSGMLSSTDDLDSLDPFYGGLAPTVSMSDDVFASKPIPKPKPKPKPRKLNNKKIDDLFGSCPEEEFDIFSSAPSNSAPQPAATQSQPTGLDDVFAPETNISLEDRKVDDLFGSSAEDLDFFSTLSKPAPQPDHKQDTPTSMDDFFDSLMKPDTNQLESMEEPCDQMASQPEPEDKSHDPFADLDFLMQAEPSGIAEPVFPVTYSVASPSQSNTAPFNQSPTDAEPDPLDDFLGGPNITSSAKESADEEVANLETDDTETTQELSAETEHISFETTEDPLADITVTASETIQDPLAEYTATTSEDLSADEKITTTEADDLEVAQEPHSETEARNLKSHATPGKLTKLSKKRSMERSFEDLLHGLSEDSDPDLDDMLVSDDNNYSTNLESLLDTPDKSVQDFSTPAKPPRFEPLFSMESEVDMARPGPMDILNDDKWEAEVTGVKVEPPEVMVETPDSEEEDIDIKSWEVVDRDDAGAEDENNSALGDEGTEEVVMRRGRTSSKTESMEGEDVDFSAIEDTNHLDVDVNKQRSALGKQGSLALRRKQSRKSRRSLLTDGDDAIFQETPGPKPSTMTNGGEDALVERDLRDSMSPPAKRPSPATMVPLPGLSRRLSEKEQKMVDDSRNDQQEDETPVETKRLSRPPPGAFRLPTVAPRPGPQMPDTEPKPGADEPMMFNKPPLKSVTKTAASTSDLDTNTFERPALRNVAPPPESGEIDDTERDITFDVPRLRSTPKPKSDKNTDEKSDFSSGVFTRPSLRSTPKHKLHIEKKEIHVDQNGEYCAFDTFGVTDTPKRHADLDTDLDKYAYDKYSSRNRDMENDENKHTFEKPVLKSSSTTERKEQAQPHAFEKPALRSPIKTAKDSTVEAENSPSGTFDKPSLRKSSSPEKVIKDSTEPKGVFDKPALRKAEVKEDKNASSNYGGFPEMKLRKTQSPEDKKEEVEREKPSWLQTAVSKQTKAQNIINYKENQRTSIEKTTPSWLERKQLRKTPLQENNSQSEDSTGDIIKPATTTTKRSTMGRGSSLGSGTGSDRDSDTEKPKPVTRSHNNYQPSWMRSVKSSLNPAGLGALTPAKSCPALDSPTEVPQWKRDLAQRRQHRKDSSGLIDTPKKEESPEPEWKRNVSLRKLRPTASPSRDTNAIEPEWKKAAEEKRARLRNSVLFDNDDDDDDATLV